MDEEIISIILLILTFTLIGSYLITSWRLYKNELPEFYKYRYSKRGKFCTDQKNYLELVETMKTILIEDP